MPPRRLSPRQPARLFFPPPLAYNHCSKAIRRRDRTRSATPASAATSNTTAAVIMIHLLVVRVMDSL